MHPIVLLIFPAVFGIDSDIEDLCHHYSNLGYTVIAVDPFWDTAPGPLPHTVEGVRAALERKREVPPDVGLSFAQACCDAAKEYGDQIVALGICFGGYMAFCSLADDDVDAAAIWHGGGLVRHIDRVADIKAPLQLHFGIEDPLIPAVDREVLGEFFSKHDNVSIMEYEGARHGFTHRSGPAFHPEVAAKCIKSLEELLVGCTSPS